MPPVPVAAESGGFLCGLTCGVVAAALSGLPPGLDASLVVAACTVGMMAAMPLFGLCADRWGRKAALQLGTAVLLFASALFLVRATGSSMALCGRFLQGVGIGCLFAALPTYISETLPEDARGRGLALFQFFVLFGQVIGAFAGLLAARFLGTGLDVWRILLALPIIPSALFLVTSLGFRLLGIFVLKDPSYVSSNEPRLPVNVHDSDRTELCVGEGLDFRGPVDRQGFRLFLDCGNAVFFGFRFKGKMSLSWEVAFWELEVCSLSQLHLVEPPKPSPQ